MLVTCRTHPTELFAMDFRIGYRRPLRTASLLRKKRQRTRLWLCALAATVATVAACTWDNAPAEKARTAAVAPAAKVALQATAATTAARRVYPYSVIPGGVGSRADIAEHVASDKIVADHYASFDVAKAHPVTVSKARAVHVSYRKGNKIYWTAGKVMLAKGETLLSDGTHEIRGRCGNRISDAAQLPVAMSEPTAAELDQLVNVPGDEGGPQNVSFDMDSILPTANPTQGRVFPGVPVANTPPVSPGTRPGMPPMPSMPNGMDLANQFLTVSSGPLLSLGPLSEASFTVTPATPDTPVPPATPDTPVTVPPVTSTPPAVVPPGIPSTPPATPSTPPATPATPAVPATPPPHADVPEPASLWLFGTAMILLLLRRRSNRAGK